VVEALPGGNQVVLEGRERRFPYGTLPITPLGEARKTVFLDASDPEVARANSPFSSAQIPQVGDLVPGNCVWVSFEYPGPLPAHVLGGNFESNINGDWIEARPRSEVEKVLGKPFVKVRATQDLEGLNIFLSLYKEEFGLFKQKVRVAGVWFDEYDVAFMIEEHVNAYLA
jgi:hypothetical protein